MREMGDSGDTNSNDVRYEVCREARHSVDQQISKLEMADRKAISLFRTNLILMGLLLTAFSVIFRSDSLNVGEFVNLGSLSGVTLLVLATVAAAMAYTSSAYDMGVDQGFVTEVSESEYTKAKLRERLENLYVGWIDHNSNVNSFNGTLITISIILVTDAIVLLGSGAVVGVYEASFTLRSGVAFIIILVLLLFLDGLIYAAESIFLKIFPEES